MRTLMLMTLVTHNGLNHVKLASFFYASFRHPTYALMSPRRGGQELRRAGRRCRGSGAQEEGPGAREGREEASGRDSGAREGKEETLGSFLNKISIP
ncbi:hypothetical protein ACLB2K_065224 [Fragaria x ananassa]